MKKILLIGDSVRIGYDRYVREAMGGMAEVLYPEENCRFSGYILRYLHLWAENLRLYDADAVHWNAGLWDTLRIYGDGPLTSPKEYADNLLRITGRLRLLFPQARLIFAASTPVLEKGYIPGYEMRYNRDVEEYNRIAEEVLLPTGTVINDLYGLMKDCPEAFHSDQTHFYTAAGTERLGGQVCRVLCRELGLDEGQLHFPDPENFAREDLPDDRDAYVPYRQFYVMRQNLPDTSSEENPPSEIGS